VVDSLASAVRRRIRASLAGDGAAASAVQEDTVPGADQAPGNGSVPTANGGVAPPNGDHAPADPEPEPPPADDGRTP
jgi:hypothetical protein